MSPQGMKIRKDPPRFDWGKIDPETYRGPSLSFPIKVELVMGPAFDEKVIDASRDFSRYYAGSELLDAESDGFNPQIQTTMEDDDGDTVELEANDLGIRLHYICGGTKVIILSINKLEDLETRH